jgi:hypothetical protein
MHNIIDVRALLNTPFISFPFVLPNLNVGIYAQLPQGAQKGSASF